jgi:hypothetical protein
VHAKDSINYLVFVLKETKSTKEKKMHKIDHASIFIRTIDANKNETKPL